MNEQRSLMASNESGNYDFSKLTKLSRDTTEAKLFQIIDDIDTASDMFKPPMNSFYKYVMKKVKEAQKYIVSDGYDLYIKGGV